MDLMTTRCGCGAVFRQPHVKARNQRCEACDRRVASMRAEAGLERRLGVDFGLADVTVVSVWQVGKDRPMITRPEASVEVTRVAVPKEDPWLTPADPNPLWARQLMPGDPKPEPAGRWQRVLGNIWRDAQRERQAAPRDYIGEAFEELERRRVAVTELLGADEPDPAKEAKPEPMCSPEEAKERLASAKRFFIEQVSRPKKESTSHRYHK